MKKVLSLVLSVILVVSCMAFAYDDEDAASIMLEVSETELPLEDTDDLSLDIIIDDLPVKLAYATVVIEIDSEYVTVDGIESDGGRRAQYEIEIEPDAPTKREIITTVDLIVDIDEEEEFEEDEIVTISIVEAELYDEDDYEIDSFYGDDAEITLVFEEDEEDEEEVEDEEEEQPEEEATDSTLVLGFEIANIDGITAKYVAGETAIDAILTLNEDGDEILVSTEAPLAEGVYELEITAEGFVVPEIKDITIDAENPAPLYKKKLLAGDITGDGKIDISDFHTMCMEKEEDQPADKLDLNRDGKINNNDIDILVESWEDLF